MQSGSSSTGSGPRAVGAACDDQIRLRTVPGDRGLFTPPLSTTAGAVPATRRRDFTAGEVLRAMVKLGFTCRGLPRNTAPARGLRAYAMLGVPAV
ncbi:hypothetical protein [Streptomyces sp. NPDC058855]|uniref:hypothetical protein n=1 Tax=Streptomyces sp. NPDC058855 TaxID=3346651 RepID=UPI00368D509D